MSGRTAAWAAWSVCGVALVLTAGILVLAVLNSDDFGNLSFSIVGVLSAVVGGVAIIVAETMFGGALVEVLDVIHPMVLLLMIGTILFGVATLRAGTLPRGGTLMLVVPLLMIASLFLLGGLDWAFTGGMALFGVGWAWLGYGLLARRREENIQARPAVR